MKIASSLFENADNNTFSNNTSWPTRKTQLIFTRLKATLSLVSQPVRVYTSREVDPTMRFQKMLLAVRKYSKLSVFAHSDFIVFKVGGGICIGDSKLRLRVLR